MKDSFWLAIFWPQKKVIFVLICSSSQEKFDGDDAFPINILGIVNQNQFGFFFSWFLFLKVIIFMFWDK
jgi:hypothetical protein